MQVKVRVKLPNVRGAVKARLDAAVPGVLNTLAAFARDRLIVAAQKNLKGRAQSEYIKGLTDQNSVEVKDTNVVVRLVGDFPNAIEKGSSSFDIKKAMLRRATKRTKDGQPYVDVPLQAQNDEERVPVSAATTMTAAIKQAHATLKSLGVSAKLRAPQTRARAKSTDTTIRRISKNSDPASWIHPGFRPANLFDGMVSEINKMASKLVASVLKGAGF